MVGELVCRSILVYQVNCQNKNTVEQYGDDKFHLESSLQTGSYKPLYERSHQVTDDAYKQKQHKIHKHTSAADRIGGNVVVEIIVTVQIVLAVLLPLICNNVLAVIVFGQIF